MPRKKNPGVSAPAQDVPAPAASAPAGVTVTYLGPAPINFRGHAFMPDEPVSGLPAEVVAVARIKPFFKVSDGNPQ